jgi:hypothetical protein
MRLRLKVPHGGLGGYNPLKYTDPSGYEVYPGPAWYDSSLGGWRYLDAYNQMHIISGGEVQEINSRAMAARNGTLRYATSEYDEMKRYLSDGPGPGSAFDEYCGKLDYIQRYGSDLYKAAKESGAITSQSYTEFLTNTLLKADFSSGFLKIANYVQVDGFIGGIVNKDGKMYGKSLIGGAMAAHISDTYIKVPGQSAGQGSGEGSGFGEVADAIKKFTSPAADLAIGGSEYNLGKVLVDRAKYGRLHPETILRTPFANISLSTKLLQNTGTALKWGGRAFGAVGLVGTYAQWQTGEIGNTEATLDATFGAIGFLPGYGWAVSGTYFLIAKPLYNYSTKP